MRLKPYFHFFKISLDFFKKHQTIGAIVLASIMLFGTFSFFSRETHTIYQPKLEAVWDDSVWTTGSLEALTNTEIEDLRLYPRSQRDQYKEGSKVKFRVVGRPLYPEKTFSATAGYSTGYNTAKYLPSGSTYYQLVDVFTEDIIIPYGSGSLVSCDSTGNYFNLDMKSLLADRFYRVEYKIVSVVERLMKPFSTLHTYHHSK